MSRPRKTTSGRPKKRRPFRNHYWPEDKVSAAIAEYKSATTEAERNRIFEAHLLLPFREMANANYQIHGSTASTMMDKREHVERMISHGVKTMDTFTVGRKSFAYFNVAMRNFLWLTNQQASAYVMSTPSIDGMLLDGEVPEDNPVLKVRVENVSYFDDLTEDMFRDEANAYWDKHFSFYFPADYVYTPAATVVLHVLTHLDWIGEESEIAPKKVFVVEIRRVYLERYGKVLKRAHMTQSLLIIRNVNTELRKCWARNDPFPSEAIAVEKHYKSHIYTPEKGKRNRQRYHQRMRERMREKIQQENARIVAAVFGGGTTQSTPATTTTENRATTGNPATTPATAEDNNIKKETTCHTG